MMRFLLVFLAGLLGVLVSSCLKDDERITPHNSGDYISDTVSMDDDYRNQIFYRLSDSSAVSTLNKDSWDLGFENSTEGWRVVLNSSCFMKTALFEGQDFGFPVDTTGVKWLFNPSSGNADSLAIGKWFTVNNGDTLGNQTLVLLDRGVDRLGNSRGLCQLVIDSLVSGTYHFRIANFDGSNPKSYSVTKNGGMNKLLFSITSPVEIIVEPDKTEWDLFFTQYTTLLYTDAGEPYPYLVTGVLINPYLVEVAVDSITQFADITFEIAQSKTFSKQADRIGYEWKTYSFDLGTYSVNSDKVYITRDTKGFLYKLRFVGFYRLNNSVFEKGYPAFEYQKL